MISVAFRAGRLRFCGFARKENESRKHRALYVEGESPSGSRSRRTRDQELRGAMSDPAPSTSTTPADRRTSIALRTTLVAAPLVIFLGIVGLYSWARLRHAARLEAQLQTEREREKSLAAVAPQSADYQRKLRELEIRVNVIQALQNSRTGPVEVMNVVLKLASQSPDVFLTSISSEADGLVLRGRARSQPAVANFLAACKKSGSFSQVRLRNFYRGDEREAPAYHFEIVCR